jgi:hypothetical protein
MRKHKPFPFAKIKPKLLRIVWYSIAILLFAATVFHNSTEYAFNSKSRSDQALNGLIFHVEKGNATDKRLQESSAEGSSFSIQSMLVVILSTAITNRTKRVRTYQSRFANSAISKQPDANSERKYYKKPKR